MISQEERDALIRYRIENANRTLDEIPINDRIVLEFVTNFPAFLQQSK